jgi:predicted GNAT superfamily acetyltransferase
MSMTIKADPLSGLQDLAACVELQRAILGGRARSVWTVQALVAVVESGGLVLGAHDAARAGSCLCGALVDLVADVDGYPARHTVFRGVLPSARNRGIGRSLRATQRAISQRQGVDLVFWDLDPLRSDEAHLAYNKLGAIATGHRRNLFGEVHDTANLGLATDRLRIEWWVDSPRVVSILDGGNPAPHFRLGIHKMSLLTETRLLQNGVRMLVGHDDAPQAEHVLAEIPADLDRIRAIDLAAAREWRLQSRAMFELLFEKGYVGTGFVHEGGRSFHLFRKADRGTALRDT